MDISILLLHESIRIILKPYFSLFYSFSPLIPPPGGVNMDFSYLSFGEVFYSH